MSSQLDFLFKQAVQYIMSGNFQSSILLLKQILQIKPKHIQALRMMAVAHAQQHLNDEALAFIDKAIGLGGGDGIAYSNKGNILQNLGRNTEAIGAYRRAIQLAPAYAEAYGNLANAQQGLLDYDGALKSYQEAISKDPLNPNFYCNLGNCLAAMGRDQEACDSYIKAIQLKPNYPDAHYFLGQLKLRNCDFYGGWEGNEWRWGSSGFSTLYLNTSIKRWDGTKTLGSLYIWAEQGIGDQILYASMLEEVQKMVESVTVSVEAKLIPVLQRSFPRCHFIDRMKTIADGKYDWQIPIGSIGQFFRKDIADFNVNSKRYILPQNTLVKKIRQTLPFSKKIVCGISWKSSNPSVGSKKSVSLEELCPIFRIKADMGFINLQYGDNRLEMDAVKEKFDIHLDSVPNVDLFDDVESLLAIIDACDLVITTSNSTAHFAGAAGKETLLLLPYSAGKFWYWHDLHGQSLWYPSIKIFRQREQDEWSHPINEITEYLEKKFAI